MEPVTHKLQVQDAERTVDLESRKTLTLSFIKGLFIEVSKEKEEAKLVEPEPEKLPERATVKRPREE